MENKIKVKLFQKKKKKKKKLNVEMAELQHRGLLNIHF